jgi:protein involved in polysaccharide export with SLBB domain
MKMSVLKGSGRWSCALLLAVAVAGCSTASYTHEDSVNPQKPFAFPAQPGAVTEQVAGQTSPGPRVPGPGDTPPVGTVPNSAQKSPVASSLRVGDFVTITFADTPNPILPQKLQIGEEGTLTLPLNVRVQAVGKSPRALEQEIRSEYVPRYYRFLTVTVQTEQRAYFVGGEVKLANRFPYIGEMTVLRAIQSAGDFTDFANRKKIELIRENGKRYQINWNKAIKDPTLDLPVYPNDQIIVHKRIW